MTVHGAAHDAGIYHVMTPGTGSFVLDGVELIKGLGFDAVKLFFSAQYATVDYALESWSSTPTTLTQLAQTTEMATALGDATLKHYILNTFGFTTTGHADLWRFGIAANPTLLADEYNEVYALCQHLLTTYDGTGKTFVLSSWEGDWALQGNTDVDGFNDITGRRIDYMVAFFRARFQAIEQARRDFGQDDVRVLGALECNRVIDALNDPNIPRVVNRVLPRLRGAMDLVSYSAYDSVFDLSIGGGGAWYSSQAEMITAIQTKLPAAIQRLQDVAGVPCIIGEWGLPEAEVPGGYVVGDLIQAVYDISVTESLPYHIYWQIFNNEPGRDFMLYRSNGTISLAGTKWQGLLS